MKSAIVIRKHLLFCFLTLLLFFSCNTRYTSWQYNQTVHQIGFEKIRYLLKDGDTLSIIGYLNGNTEIEKYPCAMDWVHFAKNWKLKLFCLSRSSTIYNYKFEKGTWIKFTDENNLICIFPKETIVQGHLCMGGGGSTGISTSFYKSGRLNCFFSSEDVKIGNVHCKGGVFNIIGLHEDGNLKECTLAKDISSKGILYKSGTRIYLDKAGNITT